jgi:hypothetical protein
LKHWKKILSGIVGVAALAVGGWFAWPLLNPPPPAPEKAFFADWGAMIVAGDWRASNGSPSEVFDNGRRELAKKFIAAGFDPKNVLQYSVRPQNYPKETVMASTAQDIMTGLGALNMTTPGGCLIYFTSHGTEEGIVIGDRMVGPSAIAERIEAACGDRPTVVIVSACYAGQFIGALRGPRRVVLAAARPDRSSFGCGEQNEFTFFDACVISEFDKVGNFSDLAVKVDQCVAAREKEMQVEERSEPQFYIGPEVTYSLNWK